MIRSILTVTFILTLLTNSIAQLGIMKHPPLELVGKVDGTNLYVQAFDFIHSNTLVLYAIENKEFIKKETIQLPEDYILQLFIYKENFFLFTSQFKTGEYSILQLDENMEEINRVKLLDEKEDFSIKDISVKDNVPRSFKYFQKENKIAISLKRTQNRFVVADLENMTFTSYISDLKKDIDYSTEDCLFGEGLEAIFALSTRYEDGALVICSNQGHQNVIIPYKDKTTGNLRKRFKFAQNNGEDFLISLYTNRSKKEQGYTVTPIKNFDFKTLDLIPVTDSTLNNPEIWTQDQYKKVIKGTIPMNFIEHNLVSAEFINGSLIVKVQDGDFLWKGNFLISRIEMTDEKPVVSWTYSSRFISNLYYDFSTKFGNQNFISFHDGNTMYLFYNIPHNDLTPAGTINLKERESISVGTFPKDTHVLKVTLDLNTGKYDTQAAKSFATKEYKGMLTNPCYQIENNELTYLLYKIDYATKQFSEPTIVSIPLD